MALRILLADDEKEFVDTLAERLSLRGYAPYVVYDGISALQAATRHGFCEPPSSGGASFQRYSISPALGTCRTPSCSRPI